MTDNLTLLSLIFAALAIGWLLGRRERGQQLMRSLHKHGLFGAGKSTQSDDVVIHPEYYQGLNFLLNERPDQALDQFVEKLEVNAGTLETHIAVGNLMRRKGEVERAIRIHQNLLSRPSLPSEHLHLAHLELARDFISAGLLDRAEGLLEDLLREAPELKEVAMGHLLEIYQSEREWQQAINTASQLLPKSWLPGKSFLKPAAADHAVAVALSHYCCELAELALEISDFVAARRWLKRAKSYDRDCVRASLQLARVEHASGHFSQAIRSLRKIRRQAPAFVAESLPLLLLCHQQQGDRDEYRRYLHESQEFYPSISVVLALTEDILQCEGAQAAADFIGAELVQRPTLRGVEKLLMLQLDGIQEEGCSNLSILHSLIAQLLDNKPQYQCQHCGFSGRQLHWLCPGCQQWGKMVPIRGAEGD